MKTNEELFAILPRSHSILEQSPTPSNRWYSLYDAWTKQQDTGGTASWYVSRDAVIKAEDKVVVGIESSMRQRPVGGGVSRPKSNSLAFLRPWAHS